MVDEEEEQEDEDEEQERDATRNNSKSCLNSRLMGKRKHLGEKGNIKSHGSFRTRVCLLWGADLLDGYADCFGYNHDELYCQSY